MHANQSAYPRARTLVHPGPFNPVRIQSRQATSAQHFRLQIQPGASLFDALVQPLAERGIHSASTTILGGLFECLQFCMAPPDPQRETIVRYTSPVDTSRSYMVFGNATIGKNQDGHPIVHCHAAIRTETGELKGGHVITQTAIAAEPLSVLVTSLEGFELRVAFDPETNIPLIQPLDSTSGETS